MEDPKMKRTLCILAAILMIASFALTGCAKKAEAKLTPADILGKSYDAMQAVKSFHFLLEHSTGGTPLGSGISMTKAEGDVVRPDKLSASLTGSALGSTVIVKLIAADGKTMMTNPLSQKWEEVGASFQALTVFDPSNGIAAIIKGLANPTLLTEEKIGDVLCYHIKGDIPTPTLAPFTGTTAKEGTVAAEVWVAKDNFLVQQVKLDGKITDTETTGIIRTLTFTNFDKDVEIKLPA
jgi:hypothetical protein